MLEQLRSQTGSLIIWLIFALIIGAFVLFFGPQAGPDMFSCGGGGQYAVEVKGKSVSVNSWRFAMNGMQYVSQYGRAKDSRRPIAIDFLLERELLAQAAAENGFRVDKEQANESIASGTFYILGRRLDGTQVYFQDGVFDYEMFERFARGSLGLPSVAQAIEEQRQELLAEMMRHFLLSSPVVSKEEARTEFILANTQASADYAKFDVARYRAALELDDEAIARYASGHEDELRQEWEQVKARWADDKDRVRARVLFVAKADAQPDADETAGDEAADDEAAGDEAAGDEAASDPARAKAEAARARIAGGEAFAAVARELSDDERTAGRGGQLGWRAADALGYGQELVDAAKDLKVGEVSPVVETSRGYYLVVIDERSSKGLSFEQKKLDLAAGPAATYYAEALARAAAEDALSRAQASSLEEVFERGDAPTLPPGMQLPPGVELAPGGDEQGSLLIEGPTVQAQIGGDAPSDTADAPTDTADAPTATAAPIELPEVDVELPPLETLQGATRNGDFLAGIGRSDELVEALFEELEVGTLADEVYQVSEPDGFVILEVTGRSDADMDEFAEQAAELRNGMALQKGMDLYVDWLQTTCRATAQAGDVKVTREYLVAEEGAEVAYNPCSFIGEQSAFEQIISRQPRL